MRKLRAGQIEKFLLVCFLTFSFALSAKEVTVGYKSSPSYPALPEEIRERIEGRAKKVQTVSRVDSMLSQDWALSNIGFFEAFTPLIQPAKMTTYPCSNIVVAVVDTGIDYTHPELRNNIWINKGETGPWAPAPGTPVTTCREKSCNGMDDDGNGFVDDVTGWDFVTNSPLPYDTHGHGTHIAGIIASAAANGMGTSGVCPEVSIMPLKYYDASGVGYNNLQNTVRAFQYAVKMGAEIINYSGGGADPALAERLAVEDSNKKGILFVAAAGNDGHNNDYQPYYPASYPLDNIISVASINRQNQLLPSSNFGKTVHVGAPGMTILSSLPGGRFGTMSGTSQATAFVTGATALLASQMKAKGQAFDYKKIKSWIIAGARPMKGNDGRQMLSAGLLSVPGSLKAEAEDQPKATPSLALVPEAKKSRIKAQ